MELAGSLVSKTLPPLRLETDAGTVSEVRHTPEPTQYRVCLFGLTESELTRASIDDCSGERRGKHAEMTKAFSFAMRLGTEVNELAIRVREAALQQGAVSGKS
jgi:hypothetical protein